MDSIYKAWVTLEKYGRADVLFKGEKIILFFKSRPGDSFAFEFPDKPAFVHFAATLEKHLERITPEKRPRFSSILLRCLFDRRFAGEMLR